jgi:quinohemoprotein ethanol dehydrogenase
MHHSMWTRIQIAFATIFSVGIATGLACAAEHTSIAPAPKFTAKQLTAPPTDGWYTNGGTLWNQRYSPLDQINKDNVANLLAVWHTKLNDSGLTARAGNQAQPIVYDGTIYMQTGEGDAYAIDIETGKILWEYKANVDPKVARACCGWPGRGLGIGEGMVFDGLLDSRLVALDQKTGKVVWEIQAADPKEGYAIESAPLYYNGLVITGFGGSDLGTRGHLNAYNAKNGKLVWTFYTVPGPGEFGHDTWPQDSDVWKHGGAAIWQTPAVDPDLGMIYFSTANPGPVLNGALRPGDNLFSVSIVAVDAKTGKYKWHFQEVHHDMWDYDAPNPVILFDVMIDGQIRKGIAEAGKTGWVYILDRTNGEPLIGIEEKPVMQNADSHTSPTQPYPVGDAIVPQFIDIAPEGYDLVNEGKIFTPFSDKTVLWKPLAAVNWPPSSYDPDSHTMYICAADSLWGAKSGGTDYPVEPGALYSGSVVARGVRAPRRGVFAALDVTTNKLVWRQQWIEQCYSGSIVTKGGLIFVGRNDGRLTALDKTNGRMLWEFQTDGGVNAPSSTFLYKGKQYVVVLAGGSALAGSKRNNGVWLFSLDGTMKSLPRGSAEPGPRGGPPGGGAPAPAAAAVKKAESTADPKHGKELYGQICVTCHGENGEGGLHGAAPALTDDTLTLEAITSTIAYGRNQMPAFGSSFSAQELSDLSAYVLDDIIGKKSD